ncbi:CusA/CzcA family heavy metal efflux RND transporter [Caulobacter segnis]|uniref:Heavy metal efflux pump, CzcA family n=2 Tax=Caulobacter segnis TaxID=88688 RepID=D5VKE5_CAUST|nr:CusA/CzcA family heavy metal efflux RND transporter [Caulobacter segnis]ADG10968.1 heavy metal efflux pump, CzcA family [Caulobacter segnis ATCC 21756]AVQ02661.1 CusA/CzcA family heavy metal efflux RND transporter [Caulobacter segnis]
MLNRLIDLSVRFRWIVVLLAVALFVLGLQQLSRLPIDAVPDITNRQVQINTVAPALGPEEVERQVTFPLETALAGTPGLVETRSLSRHGFSQITAVFTEATDLYFARTLVNERLQAARASLPDGLEPGMGPPVTGLGEVYIWTVEFKGAAARTGAPYVTPEGETLRTDVEKATYLRTVQDWIVAPQLKTLDGVAGVDVLGGYVKEYAVHPDPAKLAARGISLPQLVEALEHANRIAGAGYVQRGGEAYIVRTDARVKSLAELADTPIGRRNGAVVKVSDVATVALGHAPRLGSASENGREVVIGTALMLVGENSRTVAARVDERLKTIAPSLPPEVIIKPVLDRTRLVDATIRTVEHNLTVGALLVIAVLFFALGNFRAALITALVIPLSFLIAAIAMRRFGISGNLMSLGALDFGLIVDGAVVVIENTLGRLALRRQSEGRDLTAGERLSVAVEAAKEMARPAAFGQAIILLVYAPLLTFEGVEGKMFTPMAATVMFALAGAFVLSLTLVPALTALAVREPKGHGETKAMKAVRTRFEPVLRAAVARPKAVAIGAVAALLIGVVAFFALGREFAPTLDEGDLLVQASRVPSISLEESQAMQFEVEKVLSAQPEVALVFTRTGTAEIASDPMPPSASDTFVILKPRKDWPNPSLPKAKLIERMEGELSRLIGNAYEFTQPIQMRFNELIAGVRSDVAVKVYGDDFAAMSRTADQVAVTLRKITGAADVKVEQISGQPTITASVDRTAAAALGVHASDAADALEIGLGGREAGHILEGDRRFDVVVRLDDAKRADPAAMGQLPVVSESEGGSAIPLSSIAQFDIAEGPNQVSRENGKRRIVVQANVRGRDLGGFVTDAQAAVTRDVKPTPGSWLDWGGQFENLDRASARLGVIVPMVFLVIAMLLFFALGSAAEAMLVFACVPLALVGGALALLLRGMPFSISAAVGFIAVSGVATLNGLVLMQSIKQRIEGETDLAAAVIDGAIGRLRAVLTTALVAILGFIPMALAIGPGAEVQKPLATVVVGGLLTSTALTLLVLPTLYVWLRLQQRQTSR